MYLSTIAENSIFEPRMIID